MKIILGSQSPRRKEILGYFGLPFEQVISHFEEETVSYSGDPAKYACMISQGKAGLLAQRFPEAIMITADTVVARNGKLYGKPRDEDEAFSTFSVLSGQWHSVFTGVTIQKGKTAYSLAEETKVLFNELNEKQIRHYLTRIEWADKAGGYAIQMAGGLIVRKIDGCYYNVMGMPINTVESLLKHFGIELWDYL